MPLTAYQAQLGRLLPAAFLVAVFAGACSETTAPEPPRVLDARIAAAPSSLARYLDVELDRPGTVEVLYGTPGKPWLRKTVHAGHTARITLARLYPDAPYQVEVRGRAPDGFTGDVAQLEFHTAPLPEDLAAVTFDADGQPSNPLSMLELSGAGEGFRGFVVVDADGDVVWYYRTQGGPLGGARRAGGSFALIDRPHGLFEVSPAGEVLDHVVLDGERTIHHEVIASPWGTLLFLALDWQPARDTMVAGEGIWEWEPGSGLLAQRWSSFDHLDPDDDWGERSRPDDWIHANSLAVGPRGNILVSLHFLNQVLSIASDWQFLEWRLGGVNATIAVPDAERFSGQHTADEVSPGRVLMFDNGFERTEERYSRAVEFELDPAAGTAHNVWEWRPSPDNWSRVISLARRLPNGNTYIAFGMSDRGPLESTGPIAAYEVSPAGEVLWRLIVDGVPAMYRAWPLADLAGEAEVGG